MLVLSRRRNEKIVIGDDITITVLEVRGGPDPARHPGAAVHSGPPVEVFRAIHEGQAPPEDRPPSPPIRASDPFEPAPRVRCAGANSCLVCRPDVW